MPSTSSSTNDVGRVLGPALAIALLLAQPGSAAELSCALRAPSLAVEEETARVSLTLDCTADDGTAIAPGSTLLVGLTLYGERYPGSAETIVEQGPGIPEPGDQKRMLMADDHADNFDFPVVEVTVTPETTSEAIVFEAPAAGLADMHYWVFAAWPGDARSECDRSARYARQGCRDYGYLISFNDIKGPVMAYPGFVLVEALDQMGHEHVVPRWVVERFR